MALFKTYGISSLNSCVFGTQKILQHQKNSQKNSELINQDNNKHYICYINYSSFLA